MHYFALFSYLRDYTLMGDVSVKLVIPRDSVGIEAVHWGLGHNESIRVEGYSGEYYGISWSTTTSPYDALDAAILSNTQENSHISLRASSFTSAQIDGVESRLVVADVSRTIGFLGIFDVSWSTHSLRYSNHPRGELLMAYLSPEPLRQSDLNAMVDITGTTRVKSIFAQCMPDILKVANNNITP